jgi:cysteinyl-tRNA synthetase
MKRLMEGYNSISRIKASASDARTAATLAKIEAEETAMYEALDDDLNTPIVISHLFELVGLINKLIDGSELIDAAGLEKLTAVMKTFIFDLLGLRDESGASNSDAHAEAFGGAVDLLLALRAKAKADKDWATSDMIRNRLAELGFTVKDTKDGATWSL